MSFGVLFNIPALYAESNLDRATARLQTDYQQLSSGQRVNSAADDPAALSMIDGMQANVASLTQSITNEEEGVSMLQTADGALSQVTNMLERAITLATEASNGTLNSTQERAADQEYQSLLDEIDNIGLTTTYNQLPVFGNGSSNIISLFSSDSSKNGTSEISLNFAPVSASTLGDEGGKIKATPANGNTPATIGYENGSSVNLANTNLLTQSAARTALNSLNAAISAVAAQDGYIGSQINLTGAQEQALQTQEDATLNALDAIDAVDYAQVTSDMSKNQIMMQMAIEALAQDDQMQQLVLKLLPSS
jgi:flagellin